MSTTQIAQHTPGPWHMNTTASAGFFSAEINADASNGCVNVCSLLDADVETPPEVTEANAHLIAAAPDLLDACRLSLAQLDDSQRITGPDNATREMMRAAIAKATEGAR